MTIMKKLVIVGARGFGREVYAAVKCSKAYKDGEVSITGFLDSKSNAFEGLNGSFPPILCSPEEYEIQPDDIFFIAMGDPMWRKHYAELMKAKGAHFYTFISDSAFVSENAIVGEGSYIGRWCAVSDNVTLGEHVIMHPFTIIGHDAIIKNYGTLLTNVFIGGCAEVGECSQMSPKSMIIPHKRIGNNVMVGAASVVMRNVKDGLSVLGNPAKKIDY